MQSGCKQLLASLGIILTLSSNSLADVSEGVQNFKFVDGIVYNHLRLSGDISEADVKYLRMNVDYFKQQNDNPLFVELNAGGSDIYPAMAIGKILKDEAATVAVTENNKCTGSCIYVLAAGTRRYYSYVGDISVEYPAAADIEGNTAYEDSRNYFEGMGVSEALAGHIFNAIRLGDRSLDKSFLITFDLGRYGQDLLKQKNQEWADKIGMSVEEFKGHKTQYDIETSNCQVLRDGVDCWAKVAKQNGIWYPGMNETLSSQ